MAIELIHLVEEDIKALILSSQDSMMAYIDSEILKIKNLLMEFKLELEHIKRTACKPSVDISYIAEDGWRKY